MRHSSFQPMRDICVGSGVDRCLSFHVPGSCQPFCPPLPSCACSSPVPQCPLLIWGLQPHLTPVPLQSEGWLFCTSLLVTHGSSHVPYPQSFLCYERKTCLPNSGGSGEDDVKCPHCLQTDHNAANNVFISFSCQASHIPSPVQTCFQVFSDYKITQNLCKQSLFFK